ncbi:hypothetical protein XELAEV_18037970mg [Xenopus laevis]|uniref:GIY-YIG domain-containing protein n=1 Tax=Xenopus laevis TaxID=8355 RepID=A0A974CEA6_XENLA|nr:hypothetical protein XELAEV_18037970mg [Xenopus laevis]
MIVRSLFLKQLKQQKPADQVATPDTQSLHHSGLLFTRGSTGGRYIGETGQKFGTRMNLHRRKIRSKSVGQHCSQNHSLQHMQLLILKGNFKTEWERKINEFKSIELFNTLKGIQGLNLGSGFM